MTRSPSPYRTPVVGDPVEVAPAVLNAGAAQSPPLAYAAPAAVMPTQMRHPWRSIARSWVAAIIGLAAMADPIYSAATGHNAAAAGGYAALALAICGGVTRVLAMPGVERILRATPGLAWLAAAPAPPLTRRR